MSNAGDAPRQFDIVVERQSSAGCMKLIGSFDSSCVELFEERLREAERDHIRYLIFDLCRVELDDDGAREILAALARAHRNGLDVILVRVSRDLRESVEATGLDNVLPIAYDGGPLGTHLT
jgi:anti-anti-sigma factor